MGFFKVMVRHTCLSRILSGTVIFSSFIMLSSCPAIPVGENYLLNPGFEEGAGAPDNWVTFPPPAPGVSFSWDSTVSYEGERSVSIEIGDGSIGWSSYAPYNGIVVTAASPDVPQPLLDQLSPEGGRLVIPVGGHSFQQLKVITRFGEKFDTREDVGCTFVPLVGRHGWPEEGRQG